MARIVLGIGSSHTPLLTLPVEQWVHRAAADQANPKLNLSDGRLVTYGELQAEVGDIYAEDASIEVLTRKSEICQAALDRLGDELAAADPDVVIIVGDDQEELFGSSNQPAIAVFYGGDVITSSKYGAEGAPEWIHITGRGYLMDQSHVLAGAPAFGLEIIQGLLARDVDVATLSHVENPGGSAGFGHAFGFIVKRLFKGRSIPVLPILLNTYYPPNVPSSARCYDIGKALRAAIEASPSDLKVAIIASGGLSHFVVDEALDRRVFEGFSPGKGELLRGIERPALNSGSSEILNWVLAAGALADTPVSWSEYQPIYRTPAGTGVGVAFVVWGGQPAQGGTN
jgi:aromatic ring-opening dioxygenase catalytic subunit (LigB family)